MSHRGYDSCPASGADNICAKYQSCQTVHPTYVRLGHYRPETAYARLHKYQVHGQ